MAAQYQMEVDKLKEIIVKTISDSDRICRSGKAIDFIYDNAKVK